MTKASTQTFAFAGVSTLAGETKVRFANDQLRVKVLAKNGHKDIDLVELKNPMTKEDAIAFLISIDFDNGNETVKNALIEATMKRAVAPAKEPKVKAVKVAKPKAVKPTIEAIKAKAKPKAKVEAPVTAEDAALDDAPF